VPLRDTFVPGWTLVHLMRASLYWLLLFHSWIAGLTVRGKGGVLFRFFEPRRLDVWDLWLLSVANMEVNDACGAGSSFTSHIKLSLNYLPIFVDCRELLISHSVHVPVPV